MEGFHWRGNGKKILNDENSKKCFVFLVPSLHTAAVHCRQVFVHSKVHLRWVLSISYQLIYKLKSQIGTKMLKFKKKLKMQGGAFLKITIKFQFLKLFLKIQFSDSSRTAKFFGSANNFADKVTGFELRREADEWKHIPSERVWKTFREIHIGDASIYSRTRRARRDIQRDDVDDEERWDGRQNEAELVPQKITKRN